MGAWQTCQVSYGTRPLVARAQACQTGSHAALVRPRVRVPRLRKSFERLSDLGELRQTPEVLSLTGLMRLSSVRGAYPDFGSLWEDSPI